MLWLTAFFYLLGNQGLALNFWETKVKLTIMKPAAWNWEQNYAVNSSEFKEIFKLSNQHTLVSLNQGESSILQDISSVKNKPDHFNTQITQTYLETYLDRDSLFICGRPRNRWSLMLLGFGFFLGEEV